MVRRFQGASADATEDVSSLLQVPIDRLAYLSLSEHIFPYLKLPDNRWTPFAEKQH